MHVHVHVSGKAVKEKKKPNRILSCVSLSLTGNRGARTVFTGNLKLLATFGLMHMEEGRVCVFVGNIAFSRTEVGGSGTPLTAAWLEARRSTGRLDGCRQHYPSTPARL